MKGLTGIKAVSFDADGTLWDFDKVMRHSLRQTLLELRSIDPEAESALNIEKLIRTREQVFGELKSTMINLEKIRFEGFKRSLRDIGRPDDELALHLNEVYLKHRYGNIELFPDVLPTLNALRQRYTIGLVSNGNSYPERCGLANVFHFVVFATQCGAWKPDRRIFLTAVEKAGCSIQELLHVGDSQQEDIMGATAAGIKSIWVNRNGAPRDLGNAADHEISSLEELLEIL